MPCNPERRPSDMGDDQANRITSLVAAVALAAAAAFLVGIAVTLMGPAPAGIYPMLSGR